MLPDSFARLSQAKQSTSNSCLEVVPTIVAVLREKQVSREAGANQDDCSPGSSIRQPARGAMYACNNSRRQSPGKDTPTQ